MLLFLLFAVGLVHGEVITDPSLCGRTKCKAPTPDRKFKYEQDVHYIYRHTIDVTANLGLEKNSERPRNESTLNVDSIVSVRFTSPCEGQLKFINSSISHDRTQYNADFPDRAGADFKVNLERFVLRFFFEDGEIHELCPEPRDPVWALNIKRGVLSMLQNSMKRFDVDHRVNELDVNGICETNYQLQEARKTSLIVKKIKNLEECTFGAKHLSMLQSIIYKSPRVRSVKRPLKSKSECEITIDHNVYQKVVCKDLHELQLLSNGAKSEITTTLELVEELKDEYNPWEDEEEEKEEEDFRKMGYKRVTLLYDHGKAAKTMHGELRTARDLLKNMCRLTANSEELQQRFSEMFTNFIHSARLLDYPSLSQLFARANGICKTGKKHIIKALPFMGSNAAVNVMKDLIIKKYIPQPTIDDWVTTFALIPRPDQGTIRALAPLLEFQQSIPDVQFSLSYSAVIHAYCINEPNCGRLEQVARFLSYLEEKIENGCAPRSHSLSVIKETLEALKAIGNMGLETESLAATLKSCIDDVGGFLPMDIRVAAVDAHRRLPSCEKTRDSFFLDYYRNFTLDTEIRIASYLQVMRCPDYNVIKMIKHVLKEEEVNQVGSFVWSHLTNLYASASPTKVEIQSLLTDRDLGTKFNSDLRKFSRNYDGSFFSEDYNFGANYQSNLIFSPKSYIPRTASFNFTLDLFGESVNMFEVTARMEGLEFYAESFFGPDGPYSNEKVSEKFKSFFRSFRAAPQEQNYQDQVKRIPNVIDNNFDNPRISIGYKIFGNELKFTMFDGDKEIRTAIQNLNPWEKIKKILSGQEIHYENSGMFLDSAYVLPTVSGLPVRLDLSGSAACNFKMSGLLDTKSWISKTELKVIGNIMPSVSVDAVGKMTVDAFYKSCGLKLRGNVYSSSAVQAQLDIKGPHLTRVSIGLPNRKMEVFSAHTDILLINGNGPETEEIPLGILLTGPNQETSKELLAGRVIRNTTCSWAALDRLIGLKLCTDYQFPNVTKDPDAPYFILNGPTLFKVSLIKADPTAKNYLLEYSWERTEEQSVLKLLFDTPGSQMNREISAMVSFDAKTHNVTVLLRSVGNSLIAKGTYKRTENETLIDVGFDINGTKHLDATMGYTTKRFAHGYTYSPKFQLTINNERVAAISGTIRNAEKNNVSQCDIDLTFQTKKVWSRLTGYIVRRNVSLAGDLQLDYQLQRMPRKETLHLEASLANRSSHTLTHKAAEIKLHSTAYPHLNTVITAWYQQALGHLELQAEVNSSPHLQDDRHKLTARLIISYSKMYFQNQGTKVNVLLAITKPIQNLDIKVGVNHYAIRTESQTSLLIGYAPGKEISLLVSTVTPRSLLFSVEAHANLTIPNFNSMLIDVRIHERARREYELDFAGTWFSGHNITARGTYIDKSTPAMMSNNLKMILKSPSFTNDIMINCKFYHNHNDLKISIYVDQGDVDKYAFVLSHSIMSPTRLSTYLEAKYKNNVYFVTTNVDIEREIKVEIHLDKWRDVHLTLTCINEENTKDFGVELKWDANRDPALKFVTLLRLNRIEVLASENQYPEKTLAATVTLSYPGRLVNAKCLLTRGRSDYKMDAMIDWNPDNMIRLAAEADYDVEDTARTVKLESQLLTPFEGWKKTAFNAKYFQDEVTITGSSSVYWRDSEHIITDLYLHTESTVEATQWYINGGLTSTVHSIGWVTANVTHKVIDSHTADTRMLIKYHPDKVIDVRSIWHLDKESDSVFNVSGNVHLESPLNNYRNSDLKCQLRVLPNWKFNGAATLNIDTRKYTANLLGDLTRLKESMVQLNVTTPIEKYAYVRGRFGLSESNRHVVAEIVTPKGPLGVEAMCQIFSPITFNIKLMIATPIDIVQKALLVAKLNRREADFRVAYNNMTIGFQGVWHYNNITDFHYTYILFTPLHGLHESGIVTKLLVTSLEPDGKIDVDTEFTLRLVETVIGIKAKGGPKPPPVRVPIKVEHLVTKISDEDEEDYEGDEEEDNYYWHGELEIYPAIVEPITGELDIDVEEETYKVVSSLRLPQGKIVLRDNFWMEDVFHMKNDLSINVPFKSVQEVTSIYVFTMDLERSIYMLQMDLNVRRNATWIETGVNANYTYHESELDDSTTHIIKLLLKTPLPFLRYVDTRTIVDVDENFYKTNVAIRAENCSVDLIGSLEVEEAFLDAIFSAKVDSPALVVPKTKITAKKDFTDREKQLKLSFTIEEPTQKAIVLQAAWQTDDPNYLKASLLLNTWIESIKNIEGDVLYTNSIAKNGTSALSLALKHLDKEYKLVGDFKNGTVNGDIYIRDHYQFRGNVREIGEFLYRLDGNVKNLNNSKVYRVSADIMQRDAVCTMDMILRPETGNKFEEIAIGIKKEKYLIVFNLENYFFNATLAANCLNALNWDVRGKLNTDNAKFQLSTFMNVQVNGNTSLFVHAETPWEDVKELKLEGNVFLTNNSGDVRINHQLNRDLYYSQFQWKLLYMIDMFGRILAGCEYDNFTKNVDTQVFFKNPGRAFRNIDTGFDVNIDRENWRFAANATVGFRNHENVDAVLAVRLPKPDDDDHKFLVSYHANKGIQDMCYVIGYNAAKAKSNYASDGSIRMAARDIDGHIRFTWGMLANQSVNNLFNVTFDKKEIELKYSLFTPKFLQEETLILLFNYDGTSDVRSLVNADLCYPAWKRVGTARISYASLINVNGTVNASTTIPNFSYAGCTFTILTTLKQNKRFIEVFWPNNTALVNSDYSYHSERLDSSLEGLFHLEVPLNTRHVGHLTYGYKKRPQVMTGYSILMYNDQQILHGEYNSKSESRAGFEKDRIHITAENVFMPLGIIYINQFEYSAGNEGTNYPTVEFKQVNMHRLDNTSLFNIIGESRIRTTHTGQDIHLKAIHSNRTVQLKTDYQVLPGEFDQNFWLNLASDAWISYHLNIINKTTEDVENQLLLISFAYPRRNFTLDSSYRITSQELNSEAKLQWDQDKINPRVLSAAFDWRNSSENSIFHQEAVLSLRHPSFAKEVTVKGEVLRRDIRDLINAALVVDYSTDPQKLFLLSTLLRDESNYPTTKYIYSIVSKHPRTQLDLEVEGYVLKYESSLFETQNHGKYKRSFLPEEKGQFVGRVDVPNKEIRFHRENNEVVKHFGVRYYPEYPKYVINGSLVNTPETNASGEFFFDPREKLTSMMINYTPDAVESLRMYGNIPDARNAIFDIWRTYDQDFSISDISFYLKLNHSRLVTSTLRWRPELRNDITNTIKTAMADMYDSIHRDADYWKQYIKSETISVISDVWDDAQEDLTEFLQDWNNLKELETDFEDLKIYLNDSYNANDFYIKDIVGFGLYIIDELSLRSHIESLPNIFNEIWEIMGESGEAVRKSLIWIIETIKNAYEKVSEIVSAVLRGDSISQVADIIEKLIEKYDMFIKDLHVSFIKYIENLWNQISLSISQQWHKFLRLVEPHFIRMLHYLETVVWKASKEIVDFLYDRRNEIIHSPYFDRFTNLTQDIDKFYRDIKNNDIFTNIQKYSSLLLQFLQERYFKFVPFGNELKDVIDEILSELKELRKLPSVHYTLEKMQIIYDRANFFYEYLEIKPKIRTIIQLIHAKVMDVSQTALQAESRYREAKTKFIFDPNQGIMCLEQKLPMSWHAFNQTPEFQEIPEYRAIADLRSYFTTSNTTFWTLFYQYKPYTEPSNWLPPFRAQAVIVSSQHYMTFDGKHFDFAGTCTYLLARDFVKDTFTVLAKYYEADGKMRHKIIVLIGGKTIEIDIFEDSVKLLSAGNDLQLPIELDNGTAYVYHQENIVIVEEKNRQFRLECNLKFDLCTLELSGWYYGKIGGLFGSMDNEPMDDITSSTGYLLKNIGEFAHSWSIDGCSDSSNYASKKKQTEGPIFEFCQELFANQSSEFSSCFGIVDPYEHSKMCFGAEIQPEACTVAMSYMQICMFHDTYLRIPDRCTSCHMTDGSAVPEGHFKKLEGPNVLKSIDVVFILEAKECNQAIGNRIEQILSQMNKEFQDQGFKDNRWSLVVFGGDGVYQRPRSVVLDGQTFTKNQARFVDYFNRIPSGNGSEDVFAAIGFASQLVFRAGVAKTFILMPCSACQPEKQSLDFSVLHHVLLEHDITLHILMNGDFQFDKERLSKIFYGLDATKSYTKKDARILNGDIDLRKQVKLSKSALGYCMPLSLETNGTIFSGDKLRVDKLASVKKFASVFSKRVTMTAQPSSCQHCECIADNDGVTKMECMPCVYPTPVTVDYEAFNFNDSLSALQPMDVDYGQLDIDDD